MTAYCNYGQHTTDGPVCRHGLEFICYPHAAIMDLEKYQAMGIGRVRAAFAGHADTWEKKDGLPSGLSGSLELNGLHFYLLTSAGAREAHPNSTRPHRISVYCRGCRKWVVVGRFGQHVKTHKREVENETV